MLFSAPVFLFLFLPVVLTLYFIIPRRFKNAYLVFVSIFFYSWGERKYAIVMIGSILFNYFAALCIEYMRNRSKKGSRMVLLVAIGGNLALLVGFKYLTFLIITLNGLHIGAPLHIGDIRLPLGISFFTFHALSYIIDVYRGTTPAMKSIVDAALYISFFPQLIAGPIIRYHDISAQILTHRITRENISYGISRFIQGLAKKVLIANVLALPADQIFNQGLTGLSFGTAWLGIICYTLQIYFDFSGYSDMAIGLARIFGFTFPENFNHPYASQSITEFWRRWHISLSSWFRDYVYIPLGGNRKGALRTSIHLFVVFLLCGVWHGASWNFILWGALYGLILVIEKNILLSVLTKLPRIIRHGYTLGIVVCMWVLFRSLDLRYAGGYLKQMVDISHASKGLTDLSGYMNNHTMFILIIAILLSLSLPRPSYRGLLSTTVYRIVLLGCFIASLMSIASNTYNPFIYFRF